MRMILHTDRFEIRKTENAGKGLFAKRDFKKGDFLFKISGEIVQSCYGENYQVGPRWVSIGFEKWLNPIKFSEWYFINHSCIPNCGIKGKVMVYATRDIIKEVEITIDYSTTEHDPYWKMKCSCNAANCRKIIGPVTSLDKATYLRYLPYIPHFLQMQYLKNEPLM